MFIGKLLGHSPETIALYKMLPTKISSPKYIKTTDVIIFKLKNLCLMVHIRILRQLFPACELERKSYTNIEIVQAFRRRVLWVPCVSSTCHADDSNWNVLWMWTIQVTTRNSETVTAICVIFLLDNTALFLVLSLSNCTLVISWWVNFMG